MSRARKNFKRCTYRGCWDYPRSGRKRCGAHNFWHLETEETGNRPPKPEPGLEWCEPCKGWYQSPMHEPKPKRFTSRGALAPVSLPGLLSAA